jgi:hypothetical protein
MRWAGIIGGTIVAFVGLYYVLLKRPKRYDLGGVSENWLAQARASGGDNRSG